MNFEIIDPLDYAGWDDLLLTNQDYSFFHSAHWAKVLSETYKYKSLFFTRINNGTLLFLVPIMEVNSFITGKRGVSLPFTDSCEPLLADKQNGEKVWQSIVEYGVRSRWKYVEIRGGHFLQLSQQPSSWYYEHLLELAKDSQEVYNRFRGSNKRNIKKAQKSGVEVGLCESLDSMKEFYHLNCLTRRLHGLPPQPFSFFKNILKHIIQKKKGLLVIARYHGKAIASSIFFHFGTKAIYKYGASDSSYQQFRPNNIVLWNAIDWYCRNNFNYLSVGRTDPGHKGLRQFKAGWGTTERIINYYRYDICKGEILINRANVSGLHNNLFRNMPIWILRLIGRIIYPHVA